MPLDDPSFTRTGHSMMCRPLTASALVASLRRSLSTAQADQAAALLSTLAQADIAIADPHQWLGSQTSTTDAPCSFMRMN
jgi:hypothetical protein